MENVDVIALGELLIDFTNNGTSNQGNPIFEANPGGAPCNVLSMLAKLGKKTAFIGKVGSDQFGKLLRQTIAEAGILNDYLLEDENVPTSFEKFMESTLSIFDEPLANICSVQIPEIVENVTPGSILEHCGNKIVWPYSDKSILKQEVWEEWLLYLVIRCIESCDNVRNEGFYIIKNEEKNRKVKVLYATNHITLPEFLKDYLGNAYQDISPGQIMIIKTEKSAK